MERNIPTAETLTRVGFEFWKELGIWKIYRRFNAHTGPGLPADTDYIAVGADDFFNYTTGRDHGGQTPHGTAWDLKQWLRDLEV